MADINRGGVGGKSKVQKMVIMAMLVAVCAVAAQIAIPLGFSPVPFTLQTLVVMVIALLLSPKYAVLTILVYVAAGAVGLPVFASAKAGLGALAGPTGGFIWGFILGAFIIALLAGKGQLAIAQGVLATLAGLVVMYACGVLQLSLVGGMTFGQAFVAGAAPFLPMEAVKVVLAVIIARSGRRRKLINF